MFSTSQASIRKEKKEEEKDLEIQIGLTALAEKAIITYAQIIQKWLAS